MGFSEAGVPIDKQGVVGPARRLGHGLRGGMGEPIGGTDDEVFECVPELIDGECGRGLVERVHRETVCLAVGLRRRVIKESHLGRTVLKGRDLHRVDRLCWEGGSGSNLESETETVVAQLGEGLVDKLAVAALDAITDHRAGNLEEKTIAVDSHCLDGTERHLPDHVGDLGSDRLAAGLPDFGCLCSKYFDHHPLRSHVHSCGISCGKRPSGRPMVPGGLLHLPGGRRNVAPGVGVRTSSSHEWSFCR